MGVSRWGRGGLCECPLLCSWRELFRGGGVGCSDPLPTARLRALVQFCAVGPCLSLSRIDQVYAFPRTKETIVFSPCRVCGNVNYFGSRDCRRVFVGRNEETAAWRRLRVRRRAALSPSPPQHHLKQNPSCRQRVPTEPLIMGARYAWWSRPEAQGLLAG